MNLVSVINPVKTNGMILEHFLRLWRSSESWIVSQAVKSVRWQVIKRKEHIANAKYEAVYDCRGQRIDVEGKFQKN